MKAWLPVEVQWCSMVPKQTVNNEIGHYQSGNTLLTLLAQ
jgi:hypothetical protein